LLNLRLWNEGCEMLLADLVWPALFLEGRLLTWWAIVAGLAAEFLVLRFWLGMENRTAIVADLVMNLVSTVAGIALIPLAGVAWEIFPGSVLYPLLNVGTFNPVTWGATCIIAALINTLLEGAVLDVAFHVRFQRKVFLAVFVGNMVSVALALGSLFVIPAQT
jgi:hypothetical protein